MQVRFITLLCALTMVSIAAPCQSASSYTVAAGLAIPNGTLPWALDSFGGKAQLVPIHHSNIEVNNHKGANVAGSLAGSFFYKPKLTTELPGVHARTVLHDTKVQFYLYLENSLDDEQGASSPSSNTATIVLVRAATTKDRRVFARIQFTQLTGNAKRSDGVVETTTEKLPGGWLKLTPKDALEPGEYAITPIFKVQNTFATVVYDFTLNPTGPQAPDSIQATTVP